MASTPVPMMPMLNSSVAAGPTSGVRACAASAADPILVVPAAWSVEPVATMMKNATNCETGRPQGRVAPPVREVLPGRDAGRGAAPRNGNRPDRRRGPDSGNARRGGSVPQRTRRSTGRRSAPSGGRPPGSDRTCCCHCSHVLGPASMSGPALLLVEDELGARRALAEYLHRCGYHVYEAAAAREAMRLWDAHRADLVLLDLGLPDLDGVDVIRPSSSTPWSSSPSSRFHCAAWHTAPPPRRSCCDGTC